MLAAGYKIAELYAIAVRASSALRPAVAISRCAAAGSSSRALAALGHTLRDPSHPLSAASAAKTSYTALWLGQSDLGSGTSPRSAASRQKRSQQCACLIIAPPPFQALCSGALVVRRPVLLCEEPPARQRPAGV